MFITNNTPARTDHTPKKQNQMKFYHRKYFESKNHKILKKSNLGPRIRFHLLCSILRGRTQDTKLKISSPRESFPERYGHSFCTPNDTFFLQKPTISKVIDSFLL